MAKKPTGAEYGRMTGYKKNSKYNNLEEFSASTQKIHNKRVKFLSGRKIAKQMRDVYNIPISSLANPLSGSRASYTTKKALSSGVTKLARAKNIYSKLRVKAKLHENFLSIPGFANNTQDMMNHMSRLDRSQARKVKMRSYITNQLKANKNPNTLLSNYEENARKEKRASVSKKAAPPKQPKPAKPPAPPIKVEPSVAKTSVTKKNPLSSARKSHYTKKRKANIQNAQYKYDSPARNGRPQKQALYVKRLSNLSDSGNRYKALRASEKLLISEAASKYNPKKPSSMEEYNTKRKIVNNHRRLKNKAYDEIRVSKGQLTRAARREAKRFKNFKLTNTTRQKFKMPRPTGIKPFAKPSIKPSVFTDAIKKSDVTKPKGGKARRLLYAAGALGLLGVAYAGYRYDQKSNSRYRR